MPDSWSSPRWDEIWWESETAVDGIHDNDSGATGEAGPVVEVSITADDSDWLAGFAKDLVDARLVACANLFPAIRSVYRWQGRIEEDGEALAVLHTRLDLVQPIVARAEADHPYDVPQVVARAIVSGNPAYLDWVRAETIGPLISP